MSSNAPRSRNFRRSRHNGNAAENSNRNAASSSSNRQQMGWGTSNSRPSTSSRGVSRPVAQCFPMSTSAEEADLDPDNWGEPDPGYWERKEREVMRNESNSDDEVGVYTDANGFRHRIIAQSALVEPQSGSSFTPWVSGRIEPQYDDGTPTVHFVNCVIANPYEDRLATLSLQDSEEGTEDGNCSKDSGHVETDDSTCHSGRGMGLGRHHGPARRIVPPKQPVDDDRTLMAKLCVYSNDMLMEMIISHITQLSDRSQVELASSRMFELSKRAPYCFSTGGDHLHIHFTTFDDFATIQYDSVVRTVPILTMDTRRFDEMPSKMTIALRRILENIGQRFAKNVKKITLGGTTPFHSARGIPNHHLILTYDLMHFLLSTFSSITALHLINCGMDEGAIDLCDTSFWRESMARLESMELRCVWADTPSRMPDVLNSLTSNLQYFTLTRFTCKRMGHALLEQLRKKRCRLKEIELVIDEDSTDDPMEMFCLLKEASSHTESMRITVAETGDGMSPSPKCFHILTQLRNVPNLTELKVFVQPKNAVQFEALISLFNDLEWMTRLRSLHMEGFADMNWLSVDHIRHLERALRTGMRGVTQTLEEISFANFPKPTKYNAHGFRDHKESAYDSLWSTMSTSIGSWKTRRLTLKSMRMDDAYLRNIYNAISHVAEEVYLKNIRRVSAKSVLPLVNGEFPRLKRFEAEIAVDPLVLHNLAEVSKTPHLQYAKFALKYRITDDDHHTKMLRTMFSGVFLDQESPRGPLHQFVEVHNRIPGAVAPAKSTAVVPQSGSGNKRARRAPRPFDYRTAGYGNDARAPRQPPKLLYGEWDDPY
ncbi:hypothetical protein PFISCL1PPCAC_333 [Pristionchus fissidentatus]|uniref:F-box domain-containing protein n=1 Tax=Pristionchus fissidentatus TaxID=1538716 RepID=A0AAV5URE2_9BILA|nr:hypothetical protein PFISCL1PPCAC_333 [Pristionchus fissidentatus]